LVRQAAVVALGQSGDPQIIPALKEALKDNDPGVQRAAREALDLMGELGSDRLKRRQP